MAPRHLVSIRMESWDIVVAINIILSPLVLVIWSSTLALWNHYILIKLMVYTIVLRIFFLYIPLVRETDVFKVGNKIHNTTDDGVEMRPQIRTCSC